MAQSEGHRTRVTRNWPPKRVEVNVNNTVVVNEKLFAGGDRLLMLGPEAVELELEGHVTVVEDDATAAWNGEEGKKQRAGDPNYEKDGPSAHMAHYKNADAHGQEIDVSMHRERLGREHLESGRTMSDKEIQ